MDRNNEGSEDEGLLPEIDDHRNARVRLDGISSGSDPLGAKFRASPTGSEATEQTVVDSLLDAGLRSLQSGGSESLLEACGRSRD